MSCCGNNCSREHNLNDIDIEVISHIVDLPSLPTKKCRVMASIGGLALSYGNYLIATIIYINYDLFIAGGLLLLGFIVFGIIGSKIRNISIPLSNLEVSYTDKEIVTWYLLRYVC